MVDNKNSPGRIELDRLNLKAERRINRLTEEVRMKEGLGKEKYKKYEKLAQRGKFNKIPDEEMHKDYHNPTGRLGYHYAENLFHPRNFFRTIYDSSYIFFNGDK